MKSLSTCGSTKGYSSPDVHNVVWSIILRVKRRRVLRVAAPFFLKGERLARFNALPKNTVLHNLARDLFVSTRYADFRYLSHFLRMSRQTLRKIVFKVPGGIFLWRLRLRFLAYHEQSRSDYDKSVFLHHYEANVWGNAETVSGAGSTLQYTEHIRRVIPEIVDELGIKVILDAPCGDYNWFRLIQWKKSIVYVGGDIVEPLVERNRALHGNDSTNFIMLDVAKDHLPMANLWICRDCLFHLSNSDIFLALANFLQSDIAYMLVSTHSECKKNSDIPTGSFRLLNLQLEPFSLGEPARVINDWIEGYPVKHLCLWERESVRDTLASNKAYQRTARSHRRT